jgi:hypothetical protein
MLGGAKIQLFFRGKIRLIMCCTRLPLLIFTLRRIEETPQYFHLISKIFKVK